MCLKEPVSRNWIVFWCWCSVLQRAAGFSRMWDLPGTSKKAVGLLWLGALMPVVYNGLFQRFPHLSQQLKQYFIKLMTSEPQWYKRLLPPVCGCVPVSEAFKCREKRMARLLYTFPLMIALEGHSIHKYYFSSLAIEDYSCYKANKLTMNLGKTDYGNFVHFHSLVFTSMLVLDCRSIKLFSLTILF